MRNTVMTTGAVATLIRTERFCSEAAMTVRAVPTSVCRLFVDAAAHCGVVDALAVHVLGLDLLVDRVAEFIVLAEAALGLGELDPLLDEERAVGVLGVEHVLADELRVAAMRPHDAIEAVDDD